MNWASNLASNLFVLLLMLDMTGTIFFLVGSMFRKFIKNDVVFLRFLTVTTLCAYLVPFVYVILHLTQRFRSIRFKSNYNLFYNTPLILELEAVLGCIWIVLFLVLLIYRLYRRYRWVQICRGNIPEEDDKVMQVFAQTCAGLGIDGKVSLCRNDSIDTPCITRYHGYIVMLPLVRYTEEEARIIFYHELCHYLNGDLYLKATGCIAALLHVFNPAVHILMKRLDLICEQCCDRAACKKGKEIFTKQEYFRIILKSVLSDGKNDRYQLFALADDKSNYERRVEYMFGYHVNGGLKKSSAVVLAACFLFGSSITSLAAGDGLTDGYQDLVNETSDWSTYAAGGTDSMDVIDAMDDVTDEEAIEILAKALGLDPEKVIIMDDGIELYSDDNEPWHISWTIDPEYTYLSSGFKQVVGDVVNVIVYGTPEEQEYRMGVMDPKMTMWYVEGSGKLWMDYLVEIKGRHYFFVNNRSETDYLDVEAYIFRP